MVILVAPYLASLWVVELEKAGLVNQAPSKALLAYFLANFPFLHLKLTACLQLHSFFQQTTTSCLMR